MTDVPQICPRRSFIFTPGLRPDMFPKALASGADMVCVELEDGIAPKDKAEARRKALALFEQPLAEDGVEKLVRINSIRERFGIEDLDAILKAETAPPGLMIPKVRTPDEVVILDALLSEASLSNASRITTSSGVRTFGIISPGGAVSAFRMASRSSIPNRSRIELIRTSFSTPSSANGCSNSASALRRASALSFGAMPSSSSTQTISAPLASAFGNMSGRSPGVKIKLRRGQIWGTSVM